jgi:dihydrofolate reductase
MQHLTSIVAVNRDGVIGCGNTLPWRLKSDMRFFRQTTTGNVVVMGRKTYDSLGQRCLPNRYNVVITHHFGLFPKAEDCDFATGIEDGLFRASLAPRKYGDVFVIGGASMYEQFSPFVDRYLITLVEKDVPNGDTFFRESLLGDLADWEMQPLDSIAASSDDEASFSIFELRSRRTKEIRDRRAEAIETARCAVMVRRGRKAGGVPRHREGIPRGNLSPSFI